MGFFRKILRRAVGLKDDVALPPELSAELFSRLGPETTQTLTVVISELPSISPELRRDVICEFLDLDPRTQTWESSGEILAAVVQDFPERSRELLRKMLRA